MVASYHPNSIDIVCEMNSSPSSIPRRSVPKQQQQMHRSNHNDNSNSNSNSNNNNNNNRNDPPPQASHLKPRGNRRRHHHQQQHHSTLAIAQPTAISNNDRVHDHYLLQHKARAFFQLARVSDRNESRYNAHGNRGSFHGHGNSKRVYKNVFCGSEALDAMVESGLASSRKEGLVLGNQLASELNLFSRANPPPKSGGSGSGGQLHKNSSNNNKRAKANLMAAQTILLGSTYHRPFAETETDASFQAEASAESSAAASSSSLCFVDEANAFYCFGPGVLAILRGIDRDHNENDGNGGGCPLTKINETATTVETSFGSSHGSGNEPHHHRTNSHNKRNSGVTTTTPETDDKRSLSVVPNAPGCCGGKIVLEDLFRDQSDSCQTKTNNKKKSSNKNQACERSNTTLQKPQTVGSNSLEDLFLVRHPEMAAVVAAAPPNHRHRHRHPSEAAAPSHHRASNHNASKSGKKKAKKESSRHDSKQQPDLPPPPPQQQQLPKSILKTASGTTSQTSKKKKQGTTTTTKKTKKKPHHPKIKAGAKIKYVSDKERRIASIEKRLTVLHSKTQVSLYRTMLRELERKLSNVYTGDHLEIVSLSSHSSPHHPAPEEPFAAAAAARHDENEGSPDPPGLDANCCDPRGDPREGGCGNGDDDDDDDEDDDWDDDAFDEALESLDQIISNNASLLAEGDDNVSVWTEFIMGTTATKGTTTAGTTTKTHTDIEPSAIASTTEIAVAEPKITTTYTKPRSKKKDIKARSSLSSPKPTSSLQDSSGNRGALPPAAEQNQESKESHCPTEQQQQQLQQQQPKQSVKKPKPTGWQAPAPLECIVSSGSSRNRNKTRCDGNEIDLYSLAMDLRDRGTGGHQRNGETPTKNSHRRVPFGKKPSTVVHNGAPDDVSQLTPDDLSLFLEQHQERERKSLRNAGDNTTTPRHNHETVGTAANDDDDVCANRSSPMTFLKAFQSRTDETAESYPTRATTDSNELARRRGVPLRPKGGPPEKLVRPTEPRGGIPDGNGASYRDYFVRDTNNGMQGVESSESPPKTPTCWNGNNCDASDGSNSGIMEAIERDPFYQQAAPVRSEGGGLEAASNEPAAAETTKNSNEGEARASDSTLSTPNDSNAGSEQPGSFTESYMDFEDSYFDFDGEVETYATYSDEESYIELTVADDEEELPFEEVEEEEIVEEEFIEEEIIEEEIIEEEIIEEEIIEEGQDLCEEVTVVSESNRQPSQNQKRFVRPTLSPRRRLSRFQSARSLPPVPELEPELEPESEPEPTPRREKSVYVEVHSMPEDDEMTQITMDYSFLGTSFRSSRSLHIIPEDDYTINNADYTNQNSYLHPLAEGKEVKVDVGGNAIVSQISNRDARMTNKTSKLMMPSMPAARHRNQFSAQQHLKQRTKHVFSSSPRMARGCNAVLPTETSQQRIQEILWKDLSSKDVTVVWGALEELRILVATESRSRAYLVRHGGVMVIIDTMDEQLDVEVIQFLCCNILEQLASVDFEIGLTILELGGISLIEQSLKKHPRSQRVKEVGDAALRTLSQNS